ncbi:segregation and condensation protein A [Luteithermobacter gelatinilyticus]|uniref:segregation and condensation protein A n=1 Tax=Luteithermobacter gelatinilyticus TaxID=2582913 RepID=UPI0011075B3C|nr:ScpA family protein [Luteithermobacter gelatinilyticus]|tara:strand:+ start:1837 stop:2652 length:816 start_codon:yes stop_codon:yes gene_type:complete
MNASDETAFEGKTTFRENSDLPEHERLVLDIRGFEGPLDVLLALSRTQKVDLKQISILELVEQYLNFIAVARKLRLEVAADYLVMAAWLAYLKSRLLLPVEEKGEEPSAEELAARLTFQLQRLEALREAAAALMSRNQLGRDVFARGAPEPVRITRNATYELSLYELLKTYAEHKIRRSVSDIRIHKRKVYTLDQALERLGAMIGQVLDWTSLEAFLPSELQDRDMIRSAKASLFTATLEMARQGKAEIVQKQVFGPLMIKGKAGRETGEN